MDITPALIRDTAANLLLSNGWTQKVLRRPKADGTCSYCLTGAMWFVYCSLSETCRPEERGRLMESYNQAMESISTAIGGVRSTGSPGQRYDTRFQRLIRWNDTAGRTVAEVIELLRG